LGELATGRLIAAWWRLVPLMVLLVLARPGLAAEFRISDIRIEGLQRISAGTVFNYLPVHVGDTVTDQVTESIIRTLYGTGFFRDVNVKRAGTVLVIQVKERPAIAKINISGNRDIKADALKKALKDIGLAEGRVFNQSILDRAAEELKRQYYARAKYGVEIQTTVSPLERNRVSISIKITEGVTARIEQINIIGNKAFSEKELLSQFKLGPHNWLSFYTKNDQYSKEKLTGDLENLRSFYLDRGYIKFEIKSTQVTISPDKKDIYITIGIHEGPVYTIGDIKLAGEPTVPVKKLFPLIRLRRGEIFSRKAVTESADRISKLLGDQGYAFANVNTIPEINDKTKRVAITFFIDPGKRVYVRRINMKGNTRTRDVVLRREMRQMEAAWFSTALVKKSRERLQRLGYFDDVNIETPAVPGSADEVDVNVTVKEKPSGNLLAGIGYSQSQGIIFNGSINQNNFLGTGKRIGFAFNNSKASTNYLLGYTNPYYTIDGVSRGFELSYRTTNYADLSVASYTTDVGAAGVSFGFPITDTSRAGFGIRYQYTDFKPGSSLVAQEFALTNGNIFNDYILTASYTKDSRDSAVYPTSGSFQSLIGELSAPGSDLQWYRIMYQQRRYVPLTSHFTLAFNADLGYGNGYGSTSALPFFDNFFAGGPRSVRGWKENTLGPRQTAYGPGYNDPVGGNVRIVGSLELFAPPPVSGDLAKTLRVGAFFDFGNVWLTQGNPAIEGPIGFSLGDLRYSAGLSVAWLSPLGALSISLAYPINPQHGDQTQMFQFGFGQVF
jgi:outer membrane protein insertion porin family